MVYNNNKFLILAYTRYDGEVIKSFKKEMIRRYSKYSIQNTCYKYSKYFIEYFQKKYLKSILNIVFGILPKSDDQ
jgi:hypothetical protein